VFRFCGHCGAPLPAEGEGRDVRKVVTALFCDVMGSTELASQLDPEAVHRILRLYFDDIRETIARHGGMVQKFAGDAIFAVFGIPVLHEDDALRAVRAAAEIRERLPALAEKVGFELQFHIGLNTGLVHTDQDRSLAIGDAVNVAARLQNAAGAGEILIGPDTMRLVAGWIEAEPLDPLTLKGKVEPVEAYRLREIGAPAVDRWRPPEGPLVGREWELRLLRTAWEQTLAQRRCQQLTIVAPAGTGKSRLAHELLTWLEAAATVLRGRCLHYGEGITFWPLREALTPLGDLAREVLDGLARGGAATPQEMFLAVRRLLESVARKRPLALLIDDLQWAQPMLLDLLGHVVELSRDAPILVLCTARNELLEGDRDPPPVLRGSSVLRLQPLARSACEMLLDQLGGELPAAARKSIIAASEGNPLFLQEMVALARESGRVDIPPTIQALLAARLEQLPALEREPLERGAVEGLVFHSGAVEALMEEPSRAALAKQLSSLQRKQLIQSHPATVPGQAAFRFAHQLLRDTAYARLSLAHRTELHERFADWAEQAAPGSPALDEIVGWHLEQAASYRQHLRLGVTRKLLLRAARQLHRAGTRACERGDVSAARSLLERALALAPADDPHHAEISVTLAERLVEAGDLARADELLSPIERDESLGSQAKLVRLEWRMFAQRGEAGTGLESTLLETLSQFDAAHDERGLAKAHWLLFLLRWRTSQATLAGEQARLAAGHAREAGDIGLWSRALGWYVATLIYGPRSAGEVAAELKTVERQRPGPFLTACIAVGRAEVERRRGRFASAHELIGRALAGFRELGLPVMAATCEQIEAGISLSERDPRAARVALLRSDATLGEFEERATRSTTLAMLAQADELLGAIDEAHVALARAEAVSAPGDVVNFVITHCARARLAARSGDAREAERWARSAVEHAARTDFLGYQAEAKLELARALWIQGRSDEARKEATDARRMFKSRGDVPRAEAARHVIEHGDSAENSPVAPRAGARH
jgi:class 3 adenylate cyclase/tetratricopeptide (TPR) repeat protein